MKKTNVLFCGDNPFSMGGNGNFMAAILSQLDMDKYQPSCFAPDAPVPAIAFTPNPIPILSAGERGRMEQERLVRVLAEADLNILCMVGVDIWRYAPVIHEIIKIRNAKRFKWVYIFPYDLQMLRPDWVKWIEAVDIPCVYSRYGERMLKEAVPKIRYFRPPLYNSEFLKPFSEDEKRAARAEAFSTIGRDQFVFSFVGVNQIRKDPQKLIRAFSEAKKVNHDIALYLHTELDGVFNIPQATRDYGLNDGSVIIKQQGVRNTPGQMIKIYNSIDCLVNCSMQEGLSWTPLEAMLCGTPVICSDTTAQTELVSGAGLLVPCKEPAFIPMTGAMGRTHIEALSCKMEDIAKAMLAIVGDKRLRQEMREKGLVRGQNWLAGVCDVNDLLEEASAVGTAKAPVPKISKVLFAQHSSGGDVLMSTQCFKGIKKRHEGMELVFMTQKQYWGIIEGNPLVDEIVDWDEDLLDRYEVVYNPHGEKILPGGWNNLDVRLHDMYPYFCDVEADDMFIDPVDPELPNLPDEYIVVHTTGGQGEYRGYKHMDMVLEGIEYPAIQIGSMNDIVCAKAKLDLRGKLQWRETAWILKNAKAAICIDSFPAHLAGAMGTPTVALFGPAPARVTGPKGDRIVCLEPNMLDVCKILSHCWGNPPPGKQKCMSPCINSISPYTVRNALRGLLA